MLKLSYLSIVLLYITLNACGAQMRDTEETTRSDESSSKNQSESASAMIQFEQLIGGVWEMTLTSGVKQYQAWDWGAGKRSIRSIAIGLRDVSDPWMSEVIYWHPGNKQLRTFRVHADIPSVGRGVGVGSVKVNDDVYDGVVNLYQRSKRNLATRWKFSGKDAYRDTLFEDIGKGYQILAEWDFTRVLAKPGMPLGYADFTQTAPASFPESMKWFERIAGAKLAVDRINNTNSIQSLQSTVISCEWVASLEVMLLRLHSDARRGGEESLFDAYVYRDLESRTIRFLGLSSAGGVYEGELVTSDASDNAVVIKSNFRGAEGEDSSNYTAQFTITNDAVSSKVWKHAGDNQSLIIDVKYNKLDTK